MLDWIGSYREFKDIAFGYTGLDDSLRGHGVLRLRRLFRADDGRHAADALATTRTPSAQAIELPERVPSPGNTSRAGTAASRVAQKYGYEHYDGVLNICIAGIVYTEEPFLITVLTRGVG